MNAFEAVSKLVPVLLLIALGSLFRHTRFFQPGTAGDLKKLIVNVGLPALLFTAFAETEFQTAYMLIFGSVFAVCGMMLVIGILVRRGLGLENPFYPALYSGFETGMLGYSLFVTVFGTDNMFKLAVIDLGQVTFVFFVLVGFLRSRSGAAPTGKDLALNFVKSPVIISIVLGILAGTLGFAGWARESAAVDALYETIRLAAAITVPLICIVIGYELVLDRKALRLPLLTVALRMLILGAFAFLIDTLVIKTALRLDAVWSAALYTMFLLPPPFIIPIFMTNDTEQDRQLILSTISLHIVLSLPVFLVIALGA